MLQNIRSKIKKKKKKELKKKKMFSLTGQTIDVPLMCELNQVSKKR